MAKNSVNKSAAIRDQLTKHPDAKVKDVIAALAQKGIRVTPPLVYYIKGTIRPKGRRTKGRRAIESTHKVGMKNPVQLIIELREFAERVGGMKNLKQLVDMLAK